MKFNDIIKQVEDNSYSAFFYTPVYFKKPVSYLFNKPIEIISVYKKEDLKYAFKFIQKLIDKKYPGYSIINYEAGFLFEEKLKKLLLSQDKKLVQFCFFNKNEIKKIKSSNILFEESSKKKYSVSDFKLNKAKAQYLDDLNKIREYLKEGDTYQVNYTVKGKFKFSGSLAFFFQTLLFNQSAKYSAFINNVDEYIISLSPELFFEQKGKKIKSQPMKGTNQRGFNQVSDEQAVKELKNSEKNRAENVMIVDLIRNDFGRICRYGSISAQSLFEIEKYESLFQMISTVEGRLKKKIKMKEIIENIFPCGSVTGAPKIRTMEIINEIEKEERNIYTGSIGLITPKEIKMNVAIRTIKINRNSGEGEIGLGSGIVWDSDHHREYEEVMLKSKFLTDPTEYFEIFETMKYEDGEIKFLNEHFRRMKSVSDYFLFRFPKKRIMKRIEKTISELDQRHSKKIRLLLNKWGKIKIEASDLSESFDRVSVIISQSKILSTDRFKYFKTTNRNLYDKEYSAYKSKGYYEVLYLNEKNELAEGSRSNIFLKKDNQWFTPPLYSGALPGIYRKYFINNNINAFEKSIKIDDLRNADGLILTNALRGEIRVNRVYINDEEFIEFKD